MNVKELPTYYYNDDFYSGAGLLIKFLTMSEDKSSFIARRLAAF